MPSAHSDVTIVSAFGRGNWLAGYFAEQNYKVNLIDLSDSLGRWAPEDWEGPFGFFQSEDITDLQLERLSEEDYFEEVDEGFVVWLKDGPIDLKSPLSAHLIKQSGLSDLCEQYLSQKQNKGLRQKTKEQLKEMSFDQKWLVHIAHQLANHVHIASSESDFTEEPLELFSSMFLRRVSRRGRERSLAWCEDRGVEVYRKAVLKDISVETKYCRGIELESGGAGVLLSSQYLWMLTSEETDHLSSGVAKDLYQSKLLPEWSWMRFRMETTEDSVFEQVPTKFIFVRDLYAPWTHDNFGVIQKTESGTAFDVWLKLPYRQRFHSQYLEEVANSVVKQLTERLLPIEKVDMPQEFNYDAQEVGPPRFPVFNRSDLEKFQVNKLKNLSYCSSEFIEAMDWVSLFRKQQKIYTELDEWFKQMKNKKGAEA